MQNYKKETKQQRFYLDKNTFEHDLAPIESVEKTPFVHGRTAENENNMRASTGEQPKMRKTHERPRANNPKRKKHAFVHGRITKNEKNTRASTDERLKTMRS